MDKLNIVMTGTNAASKPFGDAITKIAKRVDRDIEIVIDTNAGDNQKSRVLQSDENIKLIIKASDVTGGDGLTFRVAIAGVATDVILAPGTIV